jgi:hypothetical protein
MYLGSILMLFSHIRLGLPSDIILSGLLEQNRVHVYDVTEKVGADASDLYLDDAD